MLVRRKKISGCIISFNCSFTLSVVAVMVYIASLQEKACIPFIHLYIRKKEGHTFMLLLLLTEVGKPGYDSWEFYICVWKSLLTLLVLLLSLFWLCLFSGESPGHQRGQITLLSSFWKSVKNSRNCHFLSDFSLTSLEEK